MGHKKFFAIIALCLLVFILVLIHEIRYASSFTIKPVNTPIIGNQPVTIYTTSTDPLLGNPGAPLTVIGFFDLGDDASNRLEKTITDFVTAHPLDVRFYWKAFPNKHFFFDNGEDIHEAAYCAAAQNAFWPFATALMNQSSANDKTLVASATTAKINLTTWQSCRDLHQSASLVETSVAAAAAVNVTQAPALFINNLAVNVTADLDVGQLLNSLIQPPVQ